MADEASLTADDLYGLYQDLALQSQLSLDDFLAAASAGEYGEVSRDAIEDFLHFLLQTMLENIDLKARENPAFQALRQETVRHTEDTFNLLFDKYT